MATTEDLLSTVLGLPSSERAHFARELLASLDEDTDPGAADEWVTEIERRVEEIASGTAKVEPWETVRARITARLRGRRR
jgi:putative addiction module component (TIGR02574 family)